MKLRKIIKKKVYKNGIIKIFTVFILSIVLMSLVTAFLYRSNTTNLKNHNNNKFLESSEVELLDTVVISNPRDPYYSLSQEITKSENATLVDSVEQLNNIYPKYLI